MRGLNVDGVTSLSSTPSESTKSSPDAFVSHRTHRKEDLGVDHIFIKPEIFLPGPDAQAQDNSVMNNPLILIKPDETVYNNVVKSTVSTVESTASSESSSFNSCNNSADISSQVDRVFIDDCHVIPRKVPCSLWDTEFLVSDHRPVHAKIIFGRRIIPNSSSSSAN